MEKISQLIHVAHDIFSQESYEEAAGSLKFFLDQITAGDLDVAAKIHCLHCPGGWHLEDIYRSPHFSLSLFLLPKNHIIPLHDHPSMWVLMRPLWGHIHVTSYDWAAEHPYSGLARNTCDLVAHRHTETLVVHPDRANIHHLRAIDDSAFLDFIFPPYSDREGRDCRYYRIREERVVMGEKLVQLVAV